MQSQLAAMRTCYRKAVCSSDDVRFAGVLVRCGAREEEESRGEKNHGPFSCSHIYFIVCATFHYVNTCKRLPHCKKDWKKEKQNIGNPANKRSSALSRLLALFSRLIITAICSTPIMCRSDLQPQFTLISDLKIHVIRVTGTKRRKTRFGLLLIG